MKISQKQIEKMAKKMGIETEGIDATEVIIRTPTKEIIISSPQVSKVNMMGQETWQIMGESTERSTSSFTDDDVKIVMQQAGVSEQSARSALEESNGDMADAIIRLKKL